MRNRALHSALRNFALEAASLLTDELRAGAEIEFDVVDGDGRRGGPVLYRYQPRTGALIEERWPLLRELPACEPACRELGAGASAWLRVNGLRHDHDERVPCPTCGSKVKPKTIGEDASPLNRDGVDC